MSFLSSIALSFLISFVVYSVVNIIKLMAGLLTGLAFKSEFIKITFLCFSIVKENGRLVFRIQNTGMFTLLKMNNSGLSKSKRFIHQCVPTALCMLLLIVSAVIFYRIKSIGGISFSIFTILIICCIYETIELIKTAAAILGNGPESQVAEYNIELMNKVNDGIRPLYFEMRDFQPYSHKPDSSYLTYLYFKFCYLLENQRYPELKPIIEVFERNRPEIFNETFTPQAYSILFYYTFVETIPEYAEKAYRYAEKMLLGDRDANGLRIYAFYLYYIKGETQKAYDIASKGMEIWQNMPDKGMGYMEHDLLEYLLGVISESSISFS